MVNPNLSSEFLTRMPELIKTLEQEKKLIFNIISYSEQGCIFKMYEETFKLFNNVMDYFVVLHIR